MDSKVNIGALKQKVSFYIFDRVFHFSFALRVCRTAKYGLKRTTSLITGKDLRHLVIAQILTMKKDTVLIVENLTRDTFEKFKSHLVRIGSRH